MTMFIPKSEIECGEWKIVKSGLDHCPDNIRFNDFLKLFDLVQDKNQLQRLVTLRFRVTNSFGKRKWIDLAVSEYTQQDGWEFELIGEVRFTPGSKAVSHIQPGSIFRITGYRPCDRTAKTLEIFHPQL